MEKKKFLILIVGVNLGVILVGFLVWVIVYYLSKPIQNPTPLDIQNYKTELVYGTKMHQKCVPLFNDFIKNYGVNYNECLVDFDFTEQFCGGFDPATQGLSNFNVEVILDASGSMGEKIFNDVRMDIAKKAVSDFLTKVPEGVNTGLIVYGHKGSNLLADKNYSCSQIEEVVKLGANNNNNILNAINSFEPKGWTPIAGSINFAKDIFKNKGPKDKNYLILLSDGGEMCDGNPLTAAEDLKLQIPGIKFIVIGFAADNNTQEFLRQIAQMGGGSSLYAGSSAQIAKVFNDQLSLIKKDCINSTLFKISSRYAKNNLNNLNCWMGLNKKELEDFNTNTKKILDTECVIEMNKALKARYTDFWTQKQAFEARNDETYKKIETDLNSQLEALKAQK